MTISEPPGCCKREDDDDASDIAANIFHSYLGQELGDVVDLVVDDHPAVRLPARLMICSCHVMIRCKAQEVARMQAHRPPIDLRLVLGDLGKCEDGHGLQ